MTQDDTKLAQQIGPGCVLRIRGDVFDVDDLLSRVTFRACHISRKGKPRFGPTSKIANATWFNVVVSESGLDNLQEQINDAEIFMNAHSGNLQYSRSYAGVTGAELDFSVRRRDVVVQNEYLPASLIRLAGKYGLAINISQYPNGSDI
ncbi:MAG TPA: hypothetical protein VH107_15340 [Lacipirellulaceae bacterium]|nr:hypothetical protein [Lacipirellulaceae bacterium]